MAQPPRLDSILSFSDLPLDQPTNQDHRQDAAPDSTSFEFEFAFAPPLHSGGGVGDLILPAYPVFDRRRLLDGGHVLAAPAASASTAPPSPDTYCPWVPRGAFPKSASTGEAHRWRLRDLVGGGGRSHSDGKEKFAFLQPAAAAPSKMSRTKKATTTAASYEKQSAKPQTQEQRQTEAGQQEEEGGDGDGHGHRAQALLRPGRRRRQEAAAAGVVPAVPAGDRRVLRQRARARPIAPPLLLTH